MFFKEENIIEINNDNIDDKFNLNRLEYPLKRVGKRGEGKFERISWKEAIDIIGEKTRSIKDRYGANSRFVYFGHNQNSLVNSELFMKRLLSLDGGFLDYYNNPNTYRIENATRLMYGTTNTGSSLNDWVNSKLIILWGHNPAETISATGMYHLREAKKAGAKIIVIDPKYNDTAISLADEWIPIHPNTDAALMDAMAYVMLSENLCDNDFLRKYSVGFDEDQMIDGIDGKNSYKSYLFGKLDGIERTPKWAERITKIPMAIIEELAREYATTRPAALIQGWGPQRNKYGEQIVRGGITLATMTGNIGINGGWASGIAHVEREVFPEIPRVKNLKEDVIAIETWPEQARLGKIKAIYNLGGNMLMDDYKEKESILKDEAMIEFILSSDIYMSKTSKYADLVLPSDMRLERDDLSKSWKDGEFIVFEGKIKETPNEARGEYDWMVALAENLGLRDEFTMGKESLKDWCVYIAEEIKNTYEDFPDFQVLEEEKIYKLRDEKPFVAFKKELEAGLEKVFPTESGKIEIFSKISYEEGNLPPTPRYMGTEEEESEYKLKYIEHHTKKKGQKNGSGRSDLENISIIWINPLDVEGMNISSGSRVKVFNNLGYSIGYGKITNKIVPGIVSIPSGTWKYLDGENKDKEIESKRVNVELYNG